MYAKIHGSSIIGLDGIITDIEVDISNGLPQVQIVGLPDSAVKEAKERVRSAIKNNGYSYPNQRITINLAPADIKKEGSGYDLPLAVGILLANQSFRPHKDIDFSSILFIGELSLSGTIQPIQGVISSVIAAKNHKFTTVIVPIGNIDEAYIIDGIKIYGFNHLSEVITFLQHNEVTDIGDKVKLKHVQNGITQYLEDFAETKGNLHVKRGVIVAVAGMHNLLMVGPPGSGKSMIAKRIPTVLPDLLWNELLEVAKIYSVSGESLSIENINKRPFRQPHHSITSTGLIGGGSLPRPGEISLAHRGVLFLDELTEYSKNMLEALRQPLEDGKVSINRVRSRITYPSKFLLVAAMNPCPCGYYGTQVPNHSCQCSPYDIQRYRSKISGPVLDRIEIQLEVPWSNIETLRDNNSSLSSSDMKAQIEKALEIQKKRFKSVGILYNSEMNTSQVKAFCKLDKEAEKVLRKAFDFLGLSGRSLDRILKVARTVSDLEGKEVIEGKHIAEAINYRLLDRKDHLQF